MRTQEEYYDLVLKNRELAKNPEVLRCPCPNGLCEWHGCCKECVALHRHHADHVPVCLQPLLREKIEQLVGVVEMVASPKEPTPLAYRHYVRERDNQTEG